MKLIKWSIIVSLLVAGLLHLFGQPIEPAYIVTAIVLVCSNTIVSSLSFFLTTTLLKLTGHQIVVKSINGHTFVYKQGTWQKSQYHMSLKWDYIALPKPKTHLYWTIPMYSWLMIVFVLVGSLYVFLRHGHPMLLLIVVLSLFYFFGAMNKMSKAKKELKQHPERYDYLYRLQQFTWHYYMNDYQYQWLDIDLSHQQIDGHIILSMLIYQLDYAIAVQQLEKSQQLLTMLPEQSVVHLQYIVAVTIGDLEKASRLYNQHLKTNRNDWYARYYALLYKVYVLQEIDVALSAESAYLKNTVSQLPVFAIWHTYYAQQLDTIDHILQHFVQ